VGAAKGIETTTEDAGGDLGMRFDVAGVGLERTSQSSRPLKSRWCGGIVMGRPRLVPSSPGSSVGLTRASISDLCLRQAFPASCAAHYNAVC